VTTNPGRFPCVRQVREPELEWKAFVIVKLTPSTSTVPPLLNGMRFRLVDAVRRVPGHQLDHAEHRAAERLLQTGDVGGMVAVTVCHGDPRRRGQGSSRSRVFVGPLSHGST